ncbi:UPF0262 family protein [Parvularcula sp. IMCC14364]|uniref:UPF0262 family protein n=1 Tax=Parvularcula sp. IMCC14364 TaxID=3067902 RepID=UPI0027424B23|nr:UPF0262 family protein [Parvularcula sp. IMCC14364]
MSTDMPSPSYRLVRVELDERSLAPANADIEHERKVAVYDLLQENMFQPLGDSEMIGEGPFVLYLSSSEGRLVMDVRKEDETPVGQLHLSMAPLRKIIKDYFLLCESYYDAIRNAAPQQIETIDMARRGMHNEGSEILEERLKDKIALDFDTARRLFTLICSFYMK